LSVANKERYQFKARGRGSRKFYGNSQDLPLDHAEKIALYHQTKDHIAFKEHQERRRSKSAWEISCELERIKQAIEMHNECFDNDLEIILKENENEVRSMTNIKINSNGEEMVELLEKDIVNLEENNE
jgi:hypothetical protein